MRITAPKLCRVGIFACAFLGAVLSAAQPDTPYTRLAKLASYISDGEPIGALEAFDKNIKRYGAITENLQALAAQAEVLCSIDVVEDKEADNDASAVHHLDVDWYMMLKSRADTSLVERRRQRVAITFQLLKGAWRITSLTPEEILAPITIK
jgi:hypothetical protein